MFFRAKKWLWTKLTEERGPDKAYAKYLANFNRVQANTDGALQKELNVKAMTKAEFIRVWNGTNQSKQGKSKQGCCSLISTVARMSNYL
tara:strand:- start:9 stop:275 length:267 start_codon:yes stop_codon:yes gene_type:complete